MTKTEKILSAFEKNPEADVKKVAARFAAPVSMVYKLRKRALATKAANKAPAARKVTITRSQAAIADRLGINTPDFVKLGLEAGLIKYDDEVDATDAILNERATTYGRFRDGAELMQNIKRTLAAHAAKHDKTFTDSQWEALEMIVHKMARIVNGDPNHVDSWRDIAGYAELVADELEGNVR